MQITVEISLYPLHLDYGNEVLSFIKDLKSYPDLGMKTNNLSTQITGEFNQVMPAIQAALENSFRKEQKAAVVMKIFNSQLDDGPGHFVHYPSFVKTGANDNYCHDGNNGITA